MPELKANSIDASPIDSKFQQRYVKACEWSKLIAITGSAQVAVQAIGFMCGILVIRLLSVEEYTFYTLANTMLGTMTILADAGVSSGVMSQGGKVWQDKKKFGAVMATGLSLRRQFAVYSLVVAVPVLMYLLRHHGASWLMSTMLVLSLMPAFVTALSGKLLEIGPKLHQDISPLQKIQVSSNAIRLAVTTLTLFVFPFAAVAILASGASQIYGNWRLRGISHSYSDRFQAEDSHVREEILGIVRRVVPGSIYYAVSGQINVWLITIFGSTKSVAEIGALGRLAMVLSLFSVLFSTLITPRFSRLPGDHATLVTRYSQVLLGFAVLGVAIVSAVALFPGQVLWILGDEYSDLTTEVILVAAAACLNLIAGCCFGLNTSRGLIVSPSFSIPYSLVIQLVLVAIMDLSSVSGVLMIAIISALGQTLLHVGYFFRSSSQ